MCCLRALFLVPTDWWVEPDALWIKFANFCSKFNQDHYTINQYQGHLYNVYTFLPQFSKHIFVIKQGLSFMNAYIVYNYVIVMHVQIWNCHQFYHNDMNLFNTSFNIISSGIAKCDWIKRKNYKTNSFWLNIIYYWCFLCHWFINKVTE